MFHFNELRHPQWIALNQSKFSKLRHSVKAFSSRLFLYSQTLLSEKNTTEKKGFTGFNNMFSNSQAAAPMTLIYSIRFVMMPPSLKSYVDLMLDPAAWRTFCVGHLVSWGPGPRGALRDTSSWWVTCSPWRQGHNAYSWPSVVALPCCVWFPAPVCPCSLPGINFWFSNYAWPSKGLHPTLAQ